jgi:hypothetical protein
VSDLNVCSIPALPPKLLIQLLNVSDLQSETPDLVLKNLQMIHMLGIAYLGGCEHDRTRANPVRGAVAGRLIRGGAIIRVAGVGCLFKSDQIFQWPESTLCRLQKSKAVLYEPNERQMAHRVGISCQPFSDPVCWALRA